MPAAAGRLTIIMKTIAKNSEAHLTQADLDRIATPDELISLPLRCHQEDCFVHGSELGTLPAQDTDASSNPSTPTK
jgi:hypothetical protein